MKECKQTRCCSGERKWKAGVEEEEVVVRNKRQALLRKLGGRVKVLYCSRACTRTSGALVLLVLLLLLEYYSTWTPPDSSILRLLTGFPRPAPAAHTRIPERPPNRNTNLVCTRLLPVCTVLYIWSGLSFSAVIRAFGGPPTRVAAK